MSTIHFLTVGEGDCTLIQHSFATGAAGRLTTLIDICNGNYVSPDESGRDPTKRMVDEILANFAAAQGNFGMAKKPTNPIEYLAKVGVSSIFRFILTHPDMDHLDGFDGLMDAFPVGNFWDSGVRRAKPSFEGGGYSEADWDRYVTVRDGSEKDTHVMSVRAGHKFKFANLGEDDKAGGCGLHVLAPDKDLIDAADDDESVNDASLMLLYRSPGGKILIPGDAHDDTWAHVLEHHGEAIRDCSVLLAPHHGRHSRANFDFLDTVNPKLTLFGCASSEHLAYDEWSRRDLPIITNNQAGNIILESVDDGIDVYVQNARFANAHGADLTRINSFGDTYLRSLAKEVKAAT